MVSRSTPLCYQRRPNLRFPGRGTSAAGGERGREYASVGGLGVREIGWVALLRAVGVPASDAILMSLVLAAMIFVISLPGAWLYIRHGLGVPEGEMSTGNVPGLSSEVSSRASPRA